MYNRGAMNPAQGDSPAAGPLIPPANSPIKLHCSVLAEDAIRQAINNYDPMMGHNNPPKLDN